MSDRHDLPCMKGMIGFGCIMVPIGRWKPPPPRVIVYRCTCGLDARRARQAKARRRRKSRSKAP